MKRDWEVIRNILIAIEDLPHGKTLSLSDFDKNMAETVSYNVILLDEAGLITANLSKTIGPGVKGFILRRLTWKGHELLDSIKDENVWNKTKSKFANGSASMTFDLVKEVAISVAKSALGL